MNKLKVVSVVGTRPEIIRLSSTLKALDNEPSIDHILIHTGQNYDYELNEVFFEDLELRKPDYFLNSATGGSAMNTVGNVISNIEPILHEEKPDAFLVLGDTNSCLSAITAKRLQIPIFHMEAGNRCFDERVPEETNRRIVDHISDINLTYSDIAREYLLKEGIKSDRVIKTGSPMFEVLHENMDAIINSDILETLELAENEYFVVSFHRDENINNTENFNNLIQTLNDMAKKYQYPIIVSTHPRTAHKLEETSLTINPLIKFMKPLGFHDYVKLQTKAKAVLSDSGTISEEASILDLKALNLREAHERPEAMEETPVMMVGLNPDRIMQGLSILENSEPYEFRLVNDYSMPNVSKKVVRIITSYVDYINRNVWHKS